MSEVSDAPDVIAWLAEIAKLAAMSEFEYYRLRKEKAKEYSVPLKILDEAVWKARGPGTRQSAEGKPSAEDLASVGLTEDGIAVAFVLKYRDQLRFCHHANAWFAWDGNRWAREETKLAFNWARDTCRKISAEGEATGKVASVLARASTAGAVERYAQADRAFAVTSECWDRDPYLLGTPGGTVDLRTGKLRPACVSEFISKQTSVAPAPEGTPHPRWSKFLNDATGGDKEFQDFLQRLAGYVLTGDVSEEVLAFLYGTGGNGKGVFIGTIAAILGTYAVSVPIEAFTAGGRLNLEYYRAQMAGARLVTASETETGACWAESQIKELTGNETQLSARNPHGRPFLFWPQFKIVLIGNYAPRLKGRSRAMERRLRIAPFTNEPEKPDPHLKVALRDEHPAILRWAIDGCLKWQKNRLGTCASVARETSQYFDQQDAFGRWLEERCLLDPYLSMKPGLLLSDFNSWAKANGEPTVSANEFSELIDRRPGLIRRKTNGVRLVVGIGLKAPDRAAEDLF